MKLNSIFMQKLTIKNLIILSIFLHLSMFLGTFFSTSIERNKKQRFIILGAHSEVPTQALFKLNSQTNKTNWHAKRVAQIKKQQEIRASIRRARIAKEKKIIEQRKRTARIKQAKAEAVKKQTSIEKSIKNKSPRKIKNKVNLKEKKEQLVSATEDKNIIATKEKVSPDMIYDKETYNEELQAEVKQYWTLSKDIDKGTRAVASFRINKDGKIKDFYLKEKSGILLYDISIRHAFLKMKISEKFWDREYDLEFIQ